MAIERDDYEYTVVEGDSLQKIAEKHGLDPVAGARKIWEYSRNGGMHTIANMHGRTRNRKLHMGNNRYVDYDHSKWKPGYRGYDRPHQIILYSGETIWIPPKDDKPERIKRVMSDDELINGFLPEAEKKYELIFPVYRVRIPKNDLVETDKFILTGKTEDNHIMYKKTLTVGDDKIEDEQYAALHFVATPKTLLYTLEIEPGGDEEGYIIVDNSPYPE